MKHAHSHIEAHRRYFPWQFLDSVLFGWLCHLCTTHSSFTVSRHIKLNGTLCWVSSCLKHVPPPNNFMTPNGSSTSTFYLPMNSPSQGTTCFFWSVQTSKRTTTKTASRTTAENGLRGRSVSYVPGTVLTAVPLLTHLIPVITPRS